MTTLKLPALIVAGLLATIPATNAGAATITYDLSGQASGDFRDIDDPSAPAQAFSAVAFNFDITADLPGVTTAAGRDLTHIDDVTLSVGGHTFDLDIGPHWLFGVDPATGVAAFGGHRMGAFAPIVRLHGPGLDGWNGQTTLDPIHVGANFLRPFRIDVGADDYRIRIDDFDRARFSAAIPEPASWALMLVGFAGAGATLRRRRALA